MKKYSLFLIKKLEILIFFLIFLIVTNCSKTDPITGEKVIIDPNLDKRASENRDKGGGLFGNIGKKDQNNNFEFATSNILWRATLKSLDFVPLNNADYSGGIIVYDWYSDKENSNEQIKLTVKFLSSELKSSSLEITSHKRICNSLGVCTIKKLDNSFNKEIKDSIINTARILKIEETKKQN